MRITMRFVMIDRPFIKEYYSLRNNIIVALFAQDVNDFGRIFFQALHSRSHRLRCSHPKNASKVLEKGKVISHTKEASPLGEVARAYVTERGFYIAPSQSPLAPALPKECLFVFLKLAHSIHRQHKRSLPFGGGGTRKRDGEGILHSPLSVAFGASSPQGEPIRFSKACVFNFTVNTKEASPLGEVARASVTEREFYIAPSQSPLAPALPKESLSVFLKLAHSIHRQHERSLPRRAYPFF